MYNACMMNIHQHSSSLFIKSGEHIGFTNITNITKHRSRMLRNAPRASPDETLLRHVDLEQDHATTSPFFFDVVLLHIMLVNHQSTCGQILSNIHGTTNNVGKSSIK